MILGIVGSPRKGHLTDQLVTSALKGVESKGVNIQKIYLIDHEIKPLKFLSSERSGCPEELNYLCEKADAYVLGAPVYYGDINGLTKDFMDTVKISNSNGKYGLGISIAGGSGKNLCQAIHSIYHWFYDRQIRGIDPTPVCRFNFKKSLQSLNQSGIKIAELSKTRKKFAAFPHIEDWIEHYEKLNIPSSSPLDEILLVTKHLLETSNQSDTLLQAKKEYEIAKVLIKRGKRIEAIKHTVKAYKTLFYN